MLGLSSVDRDHHIYLRLPQPHQQNSHPCQQQDEPVLTCGQCPTPGSSTFSALGYRLRILSALCGLIQGSSAPHSNRTGCTAHGLLHELLLNTMQNAFDD